MVSEAAAKRASKAWTRPSLKKNGRSECGDREDQVEVAEREQVLALGLGPEGLVETAAARTVAVAAGVVGEVLAAATVADGEVSAEAAGAAGEDVSRGLGLLGRQTQSGHVIAQHVGNGDCGALAAVHVTS